MKERLTGAIILVALIVLVVPELFTGPLRSKPAGVADRAAGAPASSAADAPSSKAPSSEAPPSVRSYTLALAPSGPAGGIGKPTAGRPASKPSPEGRPDAPPAADRSPPRSSPSQAPPRTAARIAPAPESKPKAKPVSHGSAHRRERTPGTPVRHRPQAAGRWVVQLASFSRHANALRLARRLRRKHFPVAVAPLRLRGRRWWRVWVGPVKGRAAAQRLARRLRPIGLRGEVLRE